MKKLRWAEGWSRRHAQDVESRRGGADGDADAGIHGAVDADGGTDATNMVSDTQLDAAWLYADPRSRRPRRGPSDARRPLSSEQPASWLVMQTAAPAAPKASGVAIVDLDREQGFALIAEMTSTRNLLAYGIRVIRTGAFVETTRDPILTMLSIGVEKLYKLTLGLVVLDRDHKWPSAVEMRAQGHKLAQMHETVLEELGTRTVDKSLFVRGLVSEVEADTVVPPLVEALDLYGRMGRFYYLDQLGDSPQPWVSPDEAWQKIESAALTDSAVAALYQAATANVGNNEAWDEFNRALNDRIATAAERVWVMVAVCGRNHALGETGGTFGFEVHPDAVGRQ